LIVPESKILVLSHPLPKSKKTKEKKTSFDDSAGKYLIKERRIENKLKIKGQ
jgi:hypothetical protein